jgi:hypothetical protein
MTILIDNFSIGVGEWLVLIDLHTLSVDVVDYAHAISTSGTHFLIDGNMVSTSFSGISSGYNVYCSAPTISGYTIVTIHAENDNGESKEESYNLLYGYNCEFNELIDWGPKKEVVITMEAENLAFCPNKETDAFFFETADLHSYNLGASIQSIESVDLNAVIYPQNTVFFYGRTYQITISGVKDFSGNEMSPYTFSFTIEDPND